MMWWWWWCRTWLVMRTGMLRELAQSFSLEAWTDRLFALTIASSTPAIGHPVMWSCRQWWWRPQVWWSVMWLVMKTMMMIQRKRWWGGWHPLGASPVSLQSAAMESNMINLRLFLHIRAGSSPRKSTISSVYNQINSTEGHTKMIVIGDRWSRSWSTVSHGWYAWLEWSPLCLLSSFLWNARRAPLKTVWTADVASWQETFRWLCTRQNLPYHLPLWVWSIYNEPFCELGMVPRSTGSWHCRAIWRQNWDFPTPASPVTSVMILVNMPPPKNLK